MSTSATRGLATIIIPCWNQLVFTRQCVAALTRHIRQPWELIVIDNGSTDGTDTYLAGVQDAASVPVTVISNTTNLGFPAAINQGLKAARGEYLVLLNNDAVVTDGWLDQLIALANMGSRDGAIHIPSEGPAIGRAGCTRAAGRPCNKFRETTSPPFVDSVISSAETTPPPFVDPVIGSAETTPPPFVDPLISSAETTPRPFVGAVIGSAETTPPPFVGAVIGSAETTPPPFVGAVIGSAETTPPGPPFARGGKGSLATPGDGSGAGGGAAIGLVGPMSNYAAPPQLVESVPYQDLRAMHAFARQWRDEHRGKWFTVRKLSGFCLLMKRAVYESIGGLDERFGIGFFDDDDLAERARRAGFVLAVAHDLFIHHFGSRTFHGNGIDAEKLLDENAKRFAAKWGKSAANGKRVALTPWSDMPAFFSESQRAFAREVDERSTGAGEENLTQRRKAAKNGNGAAAKSSGYERAVSRTEEPIVRQGATDPLDPIERARVSLTMIVRDEEENLPQCLASVRGVFDEIIVVDTGSADRTKGIAREFGAKVFDFVWIDDFAAARNEALSHATGDYAFWLDADDVVDPGQLEKLRALLAGLSRPAIHLEASPARTERRPPEAPRAVAGRGAAFVVRCACAPSPDGTKGETVVDHVRLFPLLPGVRWTYRVHEQILPSLNRLKVPVRWTDLVVRHTGYVDPVLEARKLERNIKILERELEERLGDPFVLFNIGSSAVERRQWQDALGFLGRSLAGSAPTDSIVRKIYALIARVHQMMGNSQEALRTCAEGLKLDPEDAELWFRKGVVHRHRGESAEAERCWGLILNLKRPDRFCSFLTACRQIVVRRTMRW